MPGYSSIPAFRASLRRFAPFGTSMVFFSLTNFTVGMARVSSASAGCLGAGRADGRASDLSNRRTAGIINRSGAEFQDSIASLIRHLVPRSLTVLAGFQREI